MSRLPRYNAVTLVGDNIGAQPFGYIYARSGADSCVRRRKHPDQPSRTNAARSIYRTKYKNIKKKEESLEPFHGFLSFPYGISNN